MGVWWCSTKCHSRKGLPFTHIVGLSYLFVMEVTMQYGLSISLTGREHAVVLYVFPFLLCCSTSTPAYICRFFSLIFSFVYYFPRKKPFFRKVDSNFLTENRKKSPKKIPNELQYISSHQTYVLNLNKPMFYFNLKKRSM